MQAARIRILSVIELSSRVQLSIDNLDAANLKLGMLVYGYASAVIYYIIIIMQYSGL